MKLQDDGRVLNSDGTDSGARLEYGGDWSDKDKWAIVFSCYFDDGSVLTSALGKVFDTADAALIYLEKWLKLSDVEKIKAGI